MEGWLFTKTNEPLKLVKKEDPVVKDGWVIIDVKAAGLCHSDVAALEDPAWFPLIPAAPCYIGHECAGVITEIGKGVKGFKVGDRVGVCPIDPATGKAIGYAYDGGYATKCLVPAGSLVHMPDVVTFVQGAAATDAGMTSYHALFVEGKAHKGMKVGIIGIGGLGQFAAQMAVIDGCKVYACDKNPDARDLALAIGCEKVYENVLDMKADAPEVIVDYAGFGTTTADAIEAVGFKGTVVIVGMGANYANINTMTMILKQVKVRGSNGGTPEDIAGVYKYFATGKLKPQLTTIPFTEVDKGLEMLKAGKVKGRLVAEINK